MKKKEKEGGFLEFNGEMIMGEIGSIIGSALGASLSSSYLGKNLAPAFSVGGSIIVNTIFYISSKIYHKVRKKEMSMKNLIGDLEFYAPAALPISILVGYPALYLITQYFIKTGLDPLYSGALGALFSFLIFLVLINIYRTIIFRFFRKRI